ncbi:MAG: hotdog fold thioesterase [Desulfobacteraceae bacterium]|nr:hotdog fold thioesterase [Desulfobacteraceae bacterium]
MKIETHNDIDQRLCGTPILLEEDFSKVQLLATEEMAVDGTGLVHGGFVFGLADYAAMIAVNHPNVVLGAANVKFLKPVRVDDMVEAEAKVVSKAGKRHTVFVTAKKGHKQIFEGEFTCFVLDRHVLHPS